MLITAFFHQKIDRDLTGRAYHTAHFLKLKKSKFSTNSVRTTDASALVPLHGAVT